MKNIIVCGHYECGGVRASMANNDHGLIENWIMGVKDVAKMHSEELLALGDDELIHRRLVELNVQEQCLKVYKINKYIKRPCRIDLFFQHTSKFQQQARILSLDGAAPRG